MDKIIIKGARENNLKNIDLELPKNKLIVITGVSGSGKSSLAFDTIYAEGERRYLESLSSYARQFLGGSEKPDVDSIEGLSPTIAIDQKTTSKNPRSTVGTVTEIYDYLRLLYARIGVCYCPFHNIPITSQSIDEMTNKVMMLQQGSKILVLSLAVNGEKGTYKDLFDDLRKDGYVRVIVDDKNYDLSDEIVLEKNKKHTIYVVIDRIVIDEDVRSRLYESIENACKLGDGKVVIDVLGKEKMVFSEHFSCPLCDFSVSEIEPRTFSFNAPYGACPTCNGLGIKQVIDPDLLMPNKNISIEEGGIVTLGDDTDTLTYKKLKGVCDYYGIDLSLPIKNLKKEELDIILYGTDKAIKFKIECKNGSVINNNTQFEGIINNLERRYIETTSEWIRDWIEKYMIELPCPTCNGTRLKDEVLQVKIGKKNIYELTCMSIKDIYDFIDNLKLNKEQKCIAELLIKEIKSRLSFLINVGLSYLTLSRSASTLSGGESQRIRLATQIGTSLTGVLYVLDEPSIGLHQRDNDKLISAMKKMRDLGNTLIVVEHDIDTMRQSDYLVDIGPYAGENGGRVMACGTPDEVAKCENSLTGQYLSSKRCIEVPKNRRKGNGKFLEVIGATQNNLKNIDVKFPLGTFTCVTGVSGSGKSTLVNEILYKTLAFNIYGSKVKPGKCKKIKGLNNIDKVVYISQSPIGRTPRSNPATYTGVFDDIRDIFSSCKEAKILGYDKSRFSFNVKGGRCESCHGDGVKKIEMHFLPDVYVPCSACQGKRYNSESLKIKFKGKNIADVLDMRVSEALEFFDKEPKIKRKLEVLRDVGLSYIKLGQSATTLSGGEASRIKLAKELQKKPTGKTLFIMDEPTTGLHSYDIENLLAIIKKIVDNKDSVIVIEHNLDMIKVADYIIDLGPEGGDQGGEVICCGTPEEVAKVENSATGVYLKKML